MLSFVPPIVYILGVFVLGNIWEWERIGFLSGQKVAGNSLILFSS